MATGYTAPTEIQSQAIPTALVGGDIIGCAQTGTGKTAAFVLPILDRLSHERSRHKRGLRSLILTPTRELAVQIERSILGYGRFTNLKALAVYGGVSINNQIATLRRGVDIVVATPGRLIDHIQRKTIELSGVEVLVLDEPVMGLDPASARVLREYLVELRGRGRAILLSTHILGVAEALCDRVAIMSEGRVLAEGTVSELRARAAEGGTLEEVFLRVTGKDEEVERLIEALRGC